MNSVFFIGFGVLFVGGLVAVYLQEKRRTEALKQVCASAGLVFEAEGDLDQMRALGDLTLYDLGQSKVVKNVISGRMGTQPVNVFDYQYSMGRGKRGMIVQQTLALYPGGGKALPDFILTPENVITRLGEKFGQQDIDFDSSPEFSSKYQVQGPDEAAIRLAFSEGLRRSLEREQAFSVENKAGNVAIYRYNQRVKPADVRRFVEEAGAMLRALGER
jgi:hypothetical protein